MQRTAESPATTDRDRDVALCRSILYEALALGFRRPTGRTADRLGSPDSVAALAEAAAVLDAETPQPARDGLTARVRALVDPRIARQAEALLIEHVRLFGHTVRGPVPAYETEYGDDTLFQKPQEMSDIAGFFAAFGLVLDPGHHERIDHVSCELEFLSFLARKEAHAIETGDAEMREAARRATRQFLKDHLARFVPSFARRLLTADPGGFYGRLARLCRDFVLMECADHDAPAGPEMLRLRLPIDDGAPVACGVPGGCVPGPGDPADREGCGAEDGEDPAP